MPVVSEMVHPCSMNFENQRKCVMLRDTSNLPWQDIANSLVNLKGEAPTIRLCQRVYKRYSRMLGRRVYKYANSGRKRWKVTPAVERFLIRRLTALRKQCVCTSTTLQRELLRDLNVQLECSTIRRVLRRKGFLWLPRRQKPKYSVMDKRHRLAFAEEILQLSRRELGRRFTMAMDGVVLALPPSDPVDRANFCRHGETHMWRRREEAAKPELSGEDIYNKQVPFKRALPMWGGIGIGGFGLIMWHQWRKVNQAEWAAAVDSGKLLAACKAARPDRQRGPWRILCDNESFLNAPASRAAHSRASVTLVRIPPRSPDLNPVERYWAWVRKRLQELDLADLRANRKVLGRLALKARVRALLRTRKAKLIAKRTLLSLRDVCSEVQRKKGAASGC